MTRIFMAALIMTAALTNHARALNMNYVLDTGEKLAHVNLWGAIEQGDDEKFRRVATYLLREGYLIYQINIFSGGGNVQAAKGIADQIKVLQTRTVAPFIIADIINNRRVPRRYPSCFFSSARGGYVTTAENIVHATQYNWCTCASACFLVWASGIRREGRHVGVHRIYWANEAGQWFGNLSGPQARDQYLQAQRNFQSYLETLEVPKTISDRLWATSSEKMHYLTQGELELMWSTPFLEQHVLARCGRSKHQHMSAANNWTSTEDPAHVMCYRGILKELMQEGAKKYLAQ